jgi:transcriptional regulator with XRE-family HTH domain
MDLRQIREKANLTQEQTAKITGFTVRYISLLEMVKEIQVIRLKTF